MLARRGEVLDPAGQRGDRPGDPPQQQGEAADQHDVEQQVCPISEPSWRGSRVGQRHPGDVQRASPGPLERGDEHVGFAPIAPARARAKRSRTRPMT